MYERKKALSEFGKMVKMELMNRNKTQNWLIDQLRVKLPNVCIDSSVVSKILTGDIKTGKVVDEIHHILSI